MDSFSVLSDDLLIKILSIVPTKVAVSTSILSKRWEYLWMWLPKLKYGHGCYSSFECKMLKSFLDRNLPLHRAPVIESLHLELNRPHFTPDSIKLWISVAISHCLRELELFYAPDKHDVLPRNLFTCKSLVVLKLDGGILLDVPRMVFLPSLKTLHLKGTRYFIEDFLGQLLSSCPILEDLLVELRGNEIMGELTVVAPSLQRLSLYICFRYNISGIVIKTPYLKYFKLVSYHRMNHYCLIENMPNLIEAYIDVEFPDIKNLIGALTSVKHLAICSKAMYGGGFVFNQLRHLQLCKCNGHSSDLLVQLLKDSPRLQVLELFEMNDHFHDELVRWDEPSTIPECILSSLQTFNWERYIGEQGEFDLTVYILKNARRLRTTTIKYYEWDHINNVPKCEIIEDLELAFSSRASTTCQLVLDQLFHY